jgi:phenylalanyl-tRNA synthetase beta chain
VKFTLSWLKQHLDTDAGIAEIAEAMTMAGLEVEEIIDPAAKFAAFTAARILESKQHPNADKLQVCQVETKDGVKEIVCGALNARAGLVTIYAPIGTYIPGSGITLAEKPVRGVVSHGMLCSEAELALDGDVFGLRVGRFDAWAGRAKALGVDQAAALADGGIAELPDDVKVGAPLAALLGLDDPVIDFEVTPNRPDWNGVMGIARDLAAAGIGKLKLSAAPALKAAFQSDQKIVVEDGSGCRQFVAIELRGVKNRPSPDWLQNRLRAIGLRPRSTLVDITNLLTFDRARPLHVYDLAKLSGAVRARLGKAGERVGALDGKTYAVTEAMCVIADDHGPLGLGGVIGGQASGVTEDTTDVLLESAWFEPGQIFATGRTLGLTSDAQYRFARGVDPSGLEEGAVRAAALILELCGGEASQVISAGEALAAPPAVRFDPARVQGLAGLDVAPARTKEILEALGFAVTAKGKQFDVQPPSWRRDVEGAADLVEEIARIHGFDKLPEAEPPRARGLRAPPASVGESRTRLARRALASLGYFETVAWSFCDQRHAAAFTGAAPDPALILANPIASDLDCMRPSALIHLARAAQRNLDRGFGDSRLFETGPLFRNDSDEGQRRAVAALWQARPGRHWQGAAQADLFAIKRDLISVLEAMGIAVSALQVGASGAPWLHPGRSGALKLGPKTVAVFGELHPRVLKALAVDGPALAFEAYTDDLPAVKAKVGRARPPLVKTDLMPLTRDFAFILDEAKSAGDLVRAAYGADKALIADVAVFDVYRGAGVPAGKKSLAIQVTLQPKDKTLTDADIEAVSAKVISQAAKAVGATLRG